MRHFFFKMTLGVLLSGCTFSSTQLTTLELHPAPEIELIEKVQSHKADQLVEKAATAIPLPAINTVNAAIRPECGIYIPLQVPSPVRIDFKELEAATTGKEINGIALRNVKELHQQMKNYAIAQQKHYSDYKKRCVLK